MLRIATIEDVPEMLAIYTPYVVNTTVSFEYTPPSLEEFTRRFVSYTRQFPWLVWEEDGVILGYAPPLPGPPTAGAPSPRCICGRRPGAETSPPGSTPCWRKFCGGRVIRCSTPLSVGKIPSPGGFTKSMATVSARNFPISAIKWAGGSV